MEVSSPTSRAAEDGEKLLQKFTASKSRNSSGTRLDRYDGTLDSSAYNDVLFGDSDDVDQPSFDHAVAEGSMVAQMYSTKKHGASTSLSTSWMSSADEPCRSDEAMLVLRRALNEVKDMEVKVHDKSPTDTPLDLQERLPMIAQLLHDLEGHLETDTVPVSKKIIFSPSSSRGTRGNDTPSHASVNNEIGTPRSNTKEVLKVYMKNQLDLQESESQAYEELVNDMADQLDDALRKVEELTTERDALLAEKSSWSQAACANDDTQDREKMDAERRITDVVKEKDILMVQISEKDSTIERLEMLLKEEKLKGQGLEESLQVQSSHIRNAVLSPALRRHSPSSKAQKDYPFSSPEQSPNEKGVLQNYMQNQLDLQETEWAAYEEMVNTVAEKLEDTESALEKMTLERDSYLESNHMLEQELARLNSDQSDVARGSQEKMKELEVEISRMSRESASAQAEFESVLAEKQQEVDSLKSSLGNLSSIEAEFYRVSALYSTEREEWSSLKCDLESDLKKKESEIDSLQSMVSTLESDLSESRQGIDELTDLKNIIETLTAENKESEVEIRKMKEFISAEEEVHAQEVSRLKMEAERISASRQDNDQLFDQQRLALEAKSSEVQSCNARIIELEGEIAEATAAMSSCQTQLEALKKDAEAYSSREKEMEHEYSALSRRYNDEVALNERLENELDQYQTGEALHQDDVADMRAKLETLEKSFDDVKAELKEKSRLLSDRETEIKSLTAELEQKVLEVSRKDAAVAELEGAVAERNALLAANASEFNEKSEKIAQLEASLREYDHRVYSLESDLTEEKHALRLKEEELLQLKNTLESTTSRLEELEKSKEPLQNSDNVETVQNKTISELESSNQALLENIASKDAIILRMKALFAQSLDPMGEIDHHRDAAWSPMAGSTPNSSPRNSPLKNSASGIYHQDDAERVIQAMEKKLQVQIQHLQSLQDTLYEEKRKSSYLSDVKRQFTEKVQSMEKTIHDLEDQVQAKKVEQLELSHREASSLRALEEEREKVKGLESQIVDLKVHITNNTTLIGDLQELNAKLRSDIEANHSHQFRSDDFYSEARAEAELSKVTAKLHASQQQLTELDAVVTALNANLDHKTTYASELVSEVNRLRGLVTSKDDELEALRASNLKETAELRAQLLEEERTVESLRKFISRVEEDLGETEKLYREQSQMLLEEQEVNRQMKTFLTMVDEKESTTEELLYQMQMSESSMASQLKDMSNKFVAEKETSRKALHDSESMTNRYNSLLEEFEEFKASVQAEKSNAEENKQVLLSQLEASDAMVSEKNGEIDALRALNHQLESDLSTWQRKDSERGQRGDVETKAELGRAIASIVEEFSFASKRQEQSAEGLQQSVNEWLDMYEDRIEYLSKDAERVLEALNKINSEKNAFELKCVEFEQALTSTRSEKAHVETRITSLQAENENLQEKVAEFEKTQSQLQQQIQRPKSDVTTQASLRRVHHHHHHPDHHVDDSTVEAFERDRFNRSLRTNADEQSFDGDVRSVSSHHSLTEDFTRLAEKFELTEKRALELSAEGARYFAKTSKGMALLEGDNAKLRKLVDHFRIVNAKLMGDIYAANSMVADRDGLNHRFETLEGEYTNALNKIQSLENEILTLRKEMTASMEESQLTLEERTEKLENLYREEQARVKDLEDSLTYAESSIVQLKDLNEMLERRVERESKLASDESERLNAMIIAERQRVSESDDLVSKLQAAIVELEMDKGKLESTLSQKEMSHQESILDWERSRRSMESDESKRSSRLLQLEKNVEELKHRASIDASTIADQENRIANLTEELRYAEDAIKEKQIQIDESEEVVRSLRTKSEQNNLQIDDLVGFLDEAREQLKLAEDERSSILSRSLAAEEKVKHMDVEKRLLEEKVDEVTQEKNTALDNISLCEQRIEQLSSDLSQSREEVEDLRVEVVDTRAEVNAMRVNSDARDRELTNKDNDIALLNDELQSLRNKYDKLSEDDALLQSRINEFSHIEQIESHLVTDMQAVITRMESVVGIEAMNSSGDAKGHSDDLLDTPLKTMTSSSSVYTHSNTVEALVAPSQSDSSSHLLRLRRHFDRLVHLADEHLFRSARLEESLQSSRSRLSELNSSYERLDQKFRGAVADKENLQSRCQSAEQDIEDLQKQVNELVEERDDAVHAGEDHAQWLRLIRRDLEIASSSDVVKSTLHKANLQVGEAEAIDAHELSSLGLSGAETGRDHPLESNIAHVKATILSLVKCLQASTQTLSSKEKALSKSEKQIASLKASFESDKASLNKKHDDLIFALEKEQSKSSETKEQLNSYIAENDDLKAQMQDATHHQSELEDEIKANKESIRDLRSALKDAEVLCVELRSRIRSIQSEKDAVDEDLIQARDEVSVSLRRVSELELQSEQAHLSLNRIKAERDALANTKAQLQSELEVARRDIASAKKKDALTNEEMKTIFETERLLAALGATLDHLQVTMEGNDALDDSRGRHAETDRIDNKEDSLSVRVECAVRRLSSVRTWSRDERRRKRVNEEALHDMRSELDKVKVAAEKEKVDYREAIHELQTKEHKLLLQSTSATSLKSQVEELQNEVHKLRSDRDKLQETIGSNKQALSATSTSLDNREQEVVRLKASLNDQNETIDDLKDNIMQLQSELDSRQTLCDQQEATIRGLKASNQRQKDSAERSDGVISKLKAEKAELEKKLRGKSEGEGTETSELHNRIRALEVELREGNQSHRKAVSALHDQLESVKSEKNTLSATVSSLEQKILSQSSELEAQRSKLLSSAQEVDRLRTRLDKELSDHRNTLATLSSVQALEEEWRQSAEDSQVMRESSEARYEKTTGAVHDLEDKLKRASSEIDRLNAQLVDLRNHKQKAEHESERLNLQLERVQRELHTSSSRGSALRAEGRQVRKEVLYAIDSLKEVSTVLLSLTDKNVTDDYDEVRLLSNTAMDSSSSEDLGDSLGAKQLHEILQAIHVQVKRLKSHPNELAEAHSALRKSEAENARLQKQLDTAETLHSDRVQRLHSELQQLEDRLQERSSWEVPHDSFEDRLEEMEEELKRVKHEADAREEEYKEEIELLTSEQSRAGKNSQSLLTYSRHDNSNFYSYSENYEQGTDEEAAALEIKSLKCQLRSAQKEIEAIRHHRSVLQSTVAELEQAVYQDTDNSRDRESSTRSLQLTLSQASSSASRLGTSHALSDDTAHLKRRLEGAEKLAYIYRTSLLALYVDGSFYDSLPVNIGIKEEDSDGNPLGLGWIEKDVALITAAMEEDIQALQREVLDWQFQVKQGETYRSELRARLEDTLKALYRAGKGETSSMLLHQVEHLSDDLNRRSAEVTRLKDALHSSQQQKHQHVEEVVAELVRVQQARDDFIKEASLKSRAYEKQILELKRDQEAFQDQLDGAKREASEQSEEVRKQKQKLQEQARVISNLRQELIKSDSNLDSLKRQVRSKQNASHSLPLPPQGRSSHGEQKAAGEERRHHIENSEVSAAVKRAWFTPPRGKRSPSASAESTPERAAVRRVTAHDVKNYSPASAGHSPAVARVRTSKSHGSYSRGNVDTLATSRRRPSIESIGSNSSEKPSYSSTRNRNFRH